MRKYYFVTFDGEYLSKIKDVPKMIAVASNYCADLYFYDKELKQQNKVYVGYIYQGYTGDAELPINDCKKYGVELKLVDKEYGQCYEPFYKDENLYEKYKDVKIEDIAKEV